MNSDVYGVTGACLRMRVACSYIPYVYRWESKGKRRRGVGGRYQHCVVS